MRDPNISTIASGGSFVKRTCPQTQHRTRKTQTSTTVSHRPDILSKMPQSCAIVFDCLRLGIDSEGRYLASIRDIAYITRLSPTQVWRALRRLSGANLIERASAGKGRQKTVWLVKWYNHCSSFPQPSVSLAPIRSNTRDIRAFSHQRTTSTSTQPSKKALAWAMAQIRAQVKHFLLSTEQKKLILQGIGASLWRLMQRGGIRAGPELAKLITEVMQHLRDTVGQRPVRGWCSWAGYALRSIVDAHQHQAAERKRSEALIADIRRQKKVARESWGHVSWTSWRELLPA